MSDGFQLAIESSSRRASVALGRGGEAVFAAEVEAGRRQSEVLMEPLREALTRVAGGQIELVLVGTGPGSYNGARVGIAAGQGVALIHDCPVVGVSSLEALATVGTGATCLAVGDARRGSFFTLEIRDGRISGSPNLMGHEEFLTKVGRDWSKGASLVTLEDPVRLHLPEELRAEVEWEAPSAERLLKAWQGKSDREREELRNIPPEPFYLRPPHITEPGARGRESGVE